MVLSPQGSWGTGGGLALTGWSGLLFEALLAIALFSQRMQAQQKAHPVRQLLYHPKRESKRKGSLKSEKIVRQLLGELYVDKEYLEKLLLDEGFRRLVYRRALGLGASGVDA